MALDMAGKTVSMLQVLELGEDMSLPDDVEEYSKKIDDKVSSKCFYDGVMGTFILRLFKEDNLDTGIGLRLTAIRYLMILFPRLEAIINRYSDRVMYLPYRFEIGEMLYVTVGQNPIHFGGKKYIDIREYVPSYKDAAKLVPTKSGIRISPQIICKFKRMIKTCLDEATRLIDGSSDLFNEVKLFLVERDIRTSALLYNKCDLCRVDHKEAIAHRSSGSCSDKRTWEGIVKQYFKDSIKGLRRAEVLRLATRTSKRLGGCHFVTEEFKEISDVELERSLVAISNSNEGRVYKHLHDIVQEEAEELEQKHRRDVENEQRAADADLDTDDEEPEETQKKKVKHLRERKFLKSQPSTSVQTDYDDEEEPKKKKVKVHVEQSSPFDETIQIISEESE